MTHLRTRALRASLFDAQNSVASGVAATRLHATKLDIDGNSKTHSPRSSSKKCRASRRKRRIRRSASTKASLALVSSGDRTPGGGGSPASRRRRHPETRKNNSTASSRLVDTFTPAALGNTPNPHRPRHLFGRHLEAHVAPGLRLRGCTHGRTRRAPARITFSCAACRTPPRPHPGVQHLGQGLAVGALRRDHRAHRRRHLGRGRVQIRAAGEVRLHRVERLRDRLGGEAWTTPTRPRAPRGTDRRGAAPDRAAPPNSVRARGREAAAR